MRVFLLCFGSSYLLRRGIAFSLGCGFFRARLGLG